MRLSFQAEGMVIHTLFGVIVICVALLFYKELEIERKFKETCREIGGKPILSYDGSKTCVAKSALLHEDNK